ncbi:MAG: hypothetical protein IT355_13180 [Gemmatimonadaceae bacterium]|nr:hypothetical protein [Gemmatimonadaceae bacterium]
MAPTRSYPIPPFTPLLALLQNAISEVEELGVPSMTAWLEFWRPRVFRYVAPLHAGLRHVEVTVEELTEHSLLSICAELDRCPAQTDGALHAWMSSRTTAAVLEHAATLRTVTRAAGRAA